jgi:hypothetical protein
LPDASPRSCSFTGTLRKSQERSRKMTRTNHYRRGLVLLAAGLLALLAFSVPALGKQSDLRQQSALGADKKDAAVAIQSSTTAPKASFASGSGFNFLGVKVSDHGNLISFESPVGRQAVFGGREGYAVCSGGGGTVHGHDTGDVEGGFAAPTFSQPTAGAFPLTVTRRTTDGKFQLTQVWAKPDPVEKDVTVTMTLKNISSATVTGVLLSRSGDFDIGNSSTSSTDRGAATDDSVWLWDDISTGEPGGLMLTALTFGTSRSARVEVAGVWGDPVSGSRTKCLFPSETTPTDPAGDFAMRMTYELGTFNAGQSKTAKYVYGRM